MGNATDDYVGSNVSLHTGFVFNGDSLDQGAWGYGIHPPVQNVTVLKGPLADLNDGLDNNFNGNIDELGETNSMNHFIYIQKHISNCCGLPTFTDDYYQYMDEDWDLQKKKEDVYIEIQNNAENALSSDQIYLSHLPLQTKYYDPHLHTYD